MTIPAIKVTPKTALTVEEENTFITGITATFHSHKPSNTNRPRLPRRHPSTVGEFQA